MKKAISIILAVALTLSCFAIPVSAYSFADKESVSVTGESPATDFDYSLWADETGETAAHIQKYKGTDTHVVIPSKLGKYAVSSIEYRAFRDCSFITSVVIPDGITTMV